MKQTIFAVEDDTDISRLVAHHLEAAGYGVRTFAATAGVIAEAEKQAPALFLLDIMVPGGDGLELCRRIRQSSSLAMIPVIFLTAKTSEADRVIGLELGADDYVPKPFSPRELVARVRAVLRRFERPLAPAIVKAGDIEIDSGGMTLTVRGQLTQTTATEFRLLEYLARHPGTSFHPRSVARRRVARHPLRHPALGGRVCTPHSRENRRESGRAALSENGTRSGLPLRDSEIVTSHS